MIFGLVMARASSCFSFRLRERVTAIQTSDCPVYHQAPDLRGCPESCQELLA